ncbi:MAG: hypothetical protein HXY40_02790 [Chloroflexi bacterium]|nr:hypothetical protein [Chloroflexota bacterium]
MHSTHPHPHLDTLAQYSALVLATLLLLATLALVALSTAAGAFLLAALLTLAFVPFALLPTLSTPALTLSAAGLRVQPRFWRAQFVYWDQVRAFVDYPLLPPPDLEFGRRALVGRKNYTPARGKMLLIPALPWYYRFGGWLAGAGCTPMIAITNRSHRPYDDLIEQIATHLSGQASGASL